MRNTKIIVKNKTQLARADSLNKRVIRLRDELASKWYQICDALVPIHKEKLWKLLGYKSWEEYVDIVVKQPVQSVNNYILPAEKLIGAGLELKQFDGIQLNRITDIANVVQHDKEHLDELIDKAKKNETKDDYKEFKTYVDTLLKPLGFEPKFMIRIPCDESLFQLFDETIKLEAQLLELETGEKSVKLNKTGLFESILSRYYSSISEYVRQQDDVIDIEAKEVND